MTAQQPPVGNETDAEFDVEALLASDAEQQGSDHSMPEDEEGRKMLAAAAHTPQGQPIEASCLREFKAVHESGTRALSAIRLIVIHSTESDTAQSSAHWFTNPDSGGSAHLVVDDVACSTTR
jgi:hypothetical protein